MREQSFLQDRSDGYAIYQLSNKPENHYLRFAQLSELEGPVQKGDYDLVYTGVLDHSQSEKPAAILEELFQRFNLDRPDDFHGHSLSVSDVIVLKLDHDIRGYYTDSFGFKELPGFMPDDNPLRNAEMNVEDDMNMIDGIINNGSKQEKEHTFDSALHPNEPHHRQHKRRSEPER